jgi:hypothetical protein
MPRITTEDVLYLADAAEEEAGNLRAEADDNPHERANLLEGAESIDRTAAALRRHYVKVAELLNAEGA